MSSDVVIKVEGLGKRYRIGAHQERARTLGEAVRRAAGAPFRYLRQQLRSATEAETLWALKDVSFEVSQGEVLGIIGRNGAGKSTLLKILSRITDPTEGQATIRGRVNSLLEIGTGFHPDLTGRENIYMNAALHGLKRREIARKLDEIVDFAEIEKFIDTPVKRYSSGMYTRLAFAVAAHLEPEILIVDEVLAVGDAGFQAKCLGKMGEVAKEGRTVLFVSHNMTAVRGLCHRALRLDHGKIVRQGDVGAVIDSYLSSGSSEVHHQAWATWADAPGTSQVRIRQVTLRYPGMAERARLYTNTAFDVVFQFWVSEAMPRANISTHLRTAAGEMVFNTWSHIQDLSPGLEEGILRVPGDFLNDGWYTLDFMLVSQARPLYVLDAALRFEICDYRDDVGWYGKVQGTIRPVFLRFPLQQLTAGLSK